jgi:hypothetical protein
MRVLVDPAGDAAGLNPDMLRHRIQDGKGFILLFRTGYDPYSRVNHRYLLASLISAWPKGTKKFGHDQFVSR